MKDLFIMKKYSDDMFEGYLDAGEQFWDYGTGTISGSNIVDEHKTGMSFYDQFLGTSEIEYLKNRKNLKGTVVKMSPEEYYEQCAKKIFNTSVDNLKRQRQADKDTLQHLKDVLTVYKKKFCMPMINYAEKGQEGLHRMFVIGELYGWDHKVPVLVVEWYDEERANREAEAKKQHEIDYNVEKAVKNTLRYKFTGGEDIEAQLQSELDKQFEYSDYIQVPVSIQLKETSNSYILVFNNNEYPIDKEEVQFIEESEYTDDDEFEDNLEFDDVDDWLVKYLGSNWRKEFPDAKDKVSKNEGVEETLINKEIIKQVLEDHNHSYYQNSSMALELICEKLYYEHNIDARYRGRSIYIGDRKIATIKVDREAYNMLGMYGYTLFV